MKLIKETIDNKVYYNLVGKILFTNNLFGYTFETMGAGIFKVEDKMWSVSGSLEQSEDIPYEYAVIVRRNGLDELMFAHDDLLRQGGPIKLYPFPDLSVYELVEPDIISSIYKI